jgi:hypothetical protein
MFNFLDIHTRRILSEEWLYPERHISSPWRLLGGGHLLMPDPRSLTPGSEIVIGYSDGSTHAMDSLGRPPSHRDFGHEAQSAIEHEAHRRWKAEFEQLFGTQRRGVCWNDRARRTPSDL